MNHPQNFGKIKYRKLLILVAVCLYLAAAFYPFDIETPRYIHNSFQKLPNGVLKFNNPSMARSRVSPSWLSKLIETPFVRIELEVRACETRQFGPARIFSISKDPWKRNITLAQENSDFIVRLRRPGSTLDGTPPYVVKDIFKDLDWHHIDVRIWEFYFVVIIDAKLWVSGTFESNIFENWNTNYHLTLGNELTGDRSWCGELLKAVVYVHDKVIDYTSDEAIEIPQGWWYIPERLLQSPTHDLDLFSTTPTDVALNILGFIPFGCLLAWIYRCRLSLMSSLIAAFLLSLSMELGQIIFAERIPSLIDIVFNIGGTLIGRYTYTNLVKTYNRKTI
jgi:hypothetical protein